LSFFGANYRVLLALIHASIASLRKPKLPSGNLTAGSSPLRDQEQIVCRVLPSSAMTSVVDMSGDNVPPEDDVM
jgi:hypothetical protein